MIKECNLLNIIITFKLKRSYFVKVSFFLIEVKNLSGTIIYHHHSKQFVQNSDNTEKVLKNPLTQLELQRVRFRSFFYSTNSIFPLKKTESIHWLSLPYFYI
ncbi:nuclease-related domain-containing protein [Bacillus massilioanorexius]|uniref:nuclease-related domain-containing protein n=1 Tax=Bacillus TaxID=1386 RepID=UPI0009D92BEF